MLRDAGVERKGSKGDFKVCFPCTFVCWDNAVFCY